MSIDEVKVIAMNKITFNGKKLNDNPPVITEIMELDWAWVVYYASKLFLETGDPEYAYIGGTPVLVDKNDGSAHYFKPGGMSLVDALQEYRIERGYDLKK